MNTYINPFKKMKQNKRQRIPKGQSKMDNPEKLPTQGTQDEEKQNKNTTQRKYDVNSFKFVNSNFRCSREKCIFVDTYIR